MDVINIPELIFYISLIFGVMSAAFIVMDLIFVKRKVNLATKLLWFLFAFLLIWGPAFLLWIIYVLTYRGKIN